jgi:hypothetical protein
MRLLAVSAVWLVASVSALYAVFDADATPDRASDAPKGWPAGSALSRAADRPTLLMFLHPRCPCSRASLEELSVLLAHCERHHPAVAVVLDDAGGTAAASAYWRSAAAMPGVAPVADAGAERRRFRVYTSGETLLYAPDGRLLFHGGITGGRGHSGDNPGRSAVEALLRDPAFAAGKSPHGPVYGCPLSADASDPALELAP